MCCNQCTCVDLHLAPSRGEGRVNAISVPVRVCVGCGQIITGEQGFTSFKDGDRFGFLHGACVPDDAA